MEILEERVVLDVSNPEVTLSSDVDEIGEYWKIPTLTATLSEISTEDVTVNLEFSGTATLGVDYGAWQHFIVVKAGDLTGEVQFQSKPDGTIEGDESIIIDITTVVNGMESGEQTVTINLNDDETPDPGSGPIPDVSLSVDDSEIGEYWKIPTFTVTLTEVTTDDVLVNLGFSGSATMGTDYGAWQPYIVVKAGDLTGQVLIQSVPDYTIEGDETIIVEITSVVNGKEQNGNQTVILTLKDDQTPDPGPLPMVTLSSDVSEIGEYWKIPTFTATLSEVSVYDVTVNLEFSGTSTRNDDYGAWQTYIVIPAGNLTGQILIQSKPDDFVEGDETIIVDIASVTNGMEDGVQKVTITLKDDDEPEPLPDVFKSLTIITHGGLLDEYPPWAYDMANAINVRADYGYTNGEILNSRATSADDPFTGAESFLLFDWIDSSYSLGVADNDEVAGELADMILERIDALADNEYLDLHFIGHSRGTYVNDSAIERIAGSASKIGFLQMTVLDNQPFGSDGTLTSNPGGIVDFTDNYYQTDDSFANGEPLTGAMNINLTDIVVDWDGRSNHSEIHDWYHWSIDLTDNGLPALESGSGVPVLDASTRAEIFDASNATMGDGGMVDVNPQDSLVDDWALGSMAGYYFSLIGGGVTTSSQPPFLPPASPLLAAGTAGESASAGELTDDELQPVLEEAIARWSTVVDTTLFDDLQVSIADLDGNILGLEEDGKIIIDINAAGFGWFVDATPEDDSEFRYDSTSDQLVAISDEAKDQIDLLSVLMHELGHVIGLEHDESGYHLMNSELHAGIRDADPAEIDSFFSNDSELDVVLSA